MTENIKLLYIDLFCGAGGTSTGVESAKINDAKCAKVIACVNHDKNAIASHASNHPDALHWTEDIRTLDVEPLRLYVIRMKQKYPNALVVLWASLECTNFSKAKGGQSRDADSRTLAEHLFRYIEVLNPDYIHIENVEEFMSWGPLQIKIKKDQEGYEYCPIVIKKKGKRKNKKVEICPVWVPIPELRGTYYHRWLKTIKEYNYDYQHRILDSADFGAFTSRKRFFGQFAKKGDLPITWPEPTHSKNASEGMFASRKKWKAVKEVLELDDEGESIFDRDIPLVENTLERIYAGLIKFVAGGKDKWLLKYNSINGQTGKHIPPGIDEPCPVISCQGRLGIVSTNFIQQRNSGDPFTKVVSVDGPARTLTTTGGNQELVSAQFLSKYFSGHPASKNISIDGPAHTIKTKDNHALVFAGFLSAYYGNGSNVSDIDNPAPTVRTKDTLALVSSQFIDQQYGCSKPASIEQPAGALTGNPKFNLVSCKPWLMNTNFKNVGSSLNDPAPVVTANRKWHYLMNPQYQSKGGSIDSPCFTLIARMDKQPPYLIASETGEAVIVIFENDSPCTRKIKEFMALYGIVDIKMRMLKIPELKQIMGFPKDYTLIGNQAEQKKYIGNAVEVNTAKALCSALALKLIEIEQINMAV